jgi:hypothetical protein
MKDPADQNTRIFQGAGYLIGFLIGALTAVLFVVLTGVEALIGAVAASIALPAGAALERKFQGTKPGDDQDTSDR